MSGSGHRLAFGLLTGVLAAWLIIMAVVVRFAALPPEASGTMMAIFDPGTPADVVFAGLTRAEARIVGPTDFGFVWLVSSDQPGLAGRLAANGAIGAYRELPVSPTLVGCFALADAKVSQAFQ